MLVLWWRDFYFRFINWGVELLRGVTCLSKRVNLERMVFGFEVVVFLSGVRSGEVGKGEIVG